MRTHTAVTGDIVGYVFSPEMTVPLAEHLDSLRPTDYLTADFYEYYVITMILCENETTASAQLIYTVSQEKHAEHYRLSLEEGLTNFNNFWYEYTWQNLPLNDRLFYHLTQCLSLHYLGKTEPTKYALK